MESCPQSCKDSTHNGLAVTCVVAITHILEATPVWSGTYPNLNKQGVFLERDGSGHAPSITGAVLSRVYRVYIYTCIPYCCLAVKLMLLHLYIQDYKKSIVMVSHIV